MKIKPTIVYNLNLTLHELDALHTAQKILKEVRNQFDDDAVLMIPTTGEMR